MLSTSEPRGNASKNSERAGSRVRAPTAARRWAGRLLAFSILCYFAFAGLVAMGERGGATFFSNPLLTFTMLTGVTATVAAGCCGLVALRHRDRSVIVVLSILAAAVVVFWTAMELLFPH